MRVLCDSRNVINKHETLTISNVAIIYMGYVDCSCQGVVCIAVVQITQTQ